MKALVWAIAAILALLWTGFAALSAALLSWASHIIASGAPADWGRIAATWPVPPWLSLWFDPAAVQAAQETMKWLLEVFGGMLPMAGSLVGWLVPLAWWVWGFGILFLLALAAGAHWAVARNGRLSVLSRHRAA